MPTVSLSRIWPQCQAPVNSQKAPWTHCPSSRRKKYKTSRTSLVVQWASYFQCRGHGLDLWSGELDPICHRMQLTKNKYKASKAPPNTPPTHNAHHTSPHQGSPDAAQAGALQELSYPTKPGSFTKGSLCQGQVSALQAPPPHLGSASVLLLLSLLKTMEKTFAAIVQRAMKDGHQKLTSMALTKPFEALLGVSFSSYRRSDRLGLFF